ncbi:MAG: NADH:ubiquinone reductase (Na(+)-transporting) subunit E [Pricia sp.]
MLEHIELFFRSIFIDNMVFAVFLGMCSYLAVSKKVATAVGLGAAVIFVLGVTVPLNWLLDQYLLRDGALAWLGPEYADYNLSFLSFILFIATIATMVQLVEIVIEKFSPALYNSLGIFLPLIAVNCAILGGSLFMQSRDIQTFGLAVNYGISSGIGWFLAILTIAAIREKIRYSNVPAPLRGLGITFIITGLMGIGFQSFGGMLTGGDESAAEEAIEEVSIGTGDEGDTAEAKVFLTRDGKSAFGKKQSSDAPLGEQAKASSKIEETKMEQELADKEKEVSYNDALKN